ncbi:MAG: glycoside hydrolase family 15 protein [Saprospiraceae bacterium]
MNKHKYNYGIIGNCSYLALIDTHGDVGWMCWPRFDSSFIFGNLLDQQKGGHFAVRPEDDDYESSQAYVPNTNILETTFTGKDWAFKLVDFAPRFAQYDRYFRPLMLARKIVPIKGRPRIRVICDPKGNYGEITPTKLFGSNHIRYEGLEAPVRLTTNIPLTFVDNQTPFALRETKHLVLAYGVPLEAPVESTVESFLVKTKQYWQKWVRNTSTEHFRQEAVIRSALTLKLHQYQDTGAIIAAATTSLPEFPGSTRNWDYRFCWMRDSHYTLKALNDLSHFGILRDYASFIENITVKEDKRFHPLYPITIDRVPTETILDLDGYQGEKPVRIGNQAFEHIQNDVYGQVLVTLLPLFNDKRLVDKEAPSLIELAKRCLEMIQKTMNEPDNGLWEFRGTSQLHSYTFLFHWAGSHAAKRIADDLGDKSMSKLARQMIKESTEMIERCYDPVRGVYTQAVGNSNLDASLLQLINMNYLNPRSAKAKQHLKVLEDELRTPTGLFYRYRHADDFGEPESTFLICAFWYVESLARMGRVKEASEIFDRLTKHANHLGLLSEDVHEASGSQWGNFPQTYSHVGLINAAFAISRKQDKPIYLL